MVPEAGKAGGGLKEGAAEVRREGKRLIAVPDEGRLRADRSVKTSEKRDLSDERAEQRTYMLVCEQKGRRKR